MKIITVEIRWLNNRLNTAEERISEKEESLRIYLGYDIEGLKKEKYEGVIIKVL